MDDALERRARDVGRSITTLSYFALTACGVSIVLLVAAAAMAVVSARPERELLPAAVLGLALTGMLVVLCVSRAHPETLVGYAGLTLFLCGFGMCYAMTLA
jgi:hypothetical protein